MRRATTTIALAIAAMAATNVARAEHQKLPPQLVALDTEEGAAIFERAKAKLDYFALSEHFQTQEKQSYCGVASAVIVLDALDVPAPEVAAWAPYRTFTQDNFFNEAAKKVHPAENVARGGMTIDQLGDLLRCHPTTPTVVHASSSSLDAFRKEAAENLARAGDFVIVNWDRGALGMETMGHLSPLGAYDAQSDRFLVMDVARYKYPPHWVPAEMLFRAMATDDASSGQSRGWVTVAKAATAPGPVGVRARNMFHVFLALVAVAFVVGGGVGGTVGFFAGKKRGRRAA